MRDKSGQGAGGERTYAHLHCGVTVDSTVAMKIISIQVGLPREAVWHGHAVTTGIFKEPVASRVFSRKLNLEGDRQGGLTLDGGGLQGGFFYSPHAYCYLE